MASDKLKDFVIFNILLSIFVHEASMFRLTEQTEYRFCKRKDWEKMEWAFEQWFKK